MSSVGRKFKRGNVQAVKTVSVAVAIPEEPEESISIPVPLIDEVSPDQSVEICTEEEELSPDVIVRCVKKLMDVGFELSYFMHTSWDPRYDYGIGGGTASIEDPEEVLFALEDPEVFCMGLDQEEGRRYRANPDQFMAELLNVTIPQWQRWKAFKDSQFQCTGVTRKNKRCGNIVHSEIDLPDVFVPGISDRCPLHIDTSQKRT